MTENMKILIAEDDLISRNLLQKMLVRFGECHIAVNGREALDAFTLAMQEGDPYTLVCLDIMMPEMDGIQCLKEMRRLENEKKIAGGREAKIVMTTALDNMKSVMEAYYRGGCNAYLVKPIERETLYATLRDCKVIS